MKSKAPSSARSNSINRIQIVWRSIAELTPDPRTPRSHPPRQIRQIARSIESFGFNLPVLVDGASKVIAGHGRLAACQLLGLTEIPTIVLEHLSETQRRAYMLADNKLAENSEWDSRLLAKQFKELAEEDLEFDLDTTGFEMAEIDQLIDGLGEGEGGGLDSADQLPECSTRPVITAPGDLWILNEHRVLCGNALDAASYVELMQKERAHAAFMDPPYNVPIEDNVSGLGTVRHGEFAMGSGEMNEAEFTRFLSNCFSLVVRYSRVGALHYICMDWRHLNELLSAGRTSYTQLRNLCVWVKNNGGMGSFYRSQHELVFVFQNGRRAHRNNVQLGQYGRNRTNVWNYPCANSFSKGGDEGNLLVLHPTVKPVAMIADAIVDCTARRDIVLDAFLGSGSTLIAAERTGRRCYGLEIEPSYVDILVRRWQAFTCNPARHAFSGETFDQRAAKAEEKCDQEQAITATK